MDPEVAAQINSDWPEDLPYEELLDAALPWLGPCISEPLRGFVAPPEADAGISYAGRTRYTQLEYEALLANLSLGIAFT